MIKQLVDFLENHWNIISVEPISFFILVLLSSFFAYMACRWRYVREISSLEKEVSLYKSKNEINEPKVGLKTPLRNEENLCFSKGKECHFKYVDPRRLEILNKYKINLYIPLEKDLSHLSSQKNNEVSLFPYLNNWGNFIEKPEFTPNLGYKFNGHNMISLHTNHHFPSNKEARTFIFAVNPTEMATQERPMFFFSYGQRKSHEPGSEINNHDKSFGVYWGKPMPKDPIPSESLGLGTRVFFYCEHSKEDRTSDNCDTQVISNISELNKWIIYAVTYDGLVLKFYQNGECIFSSDYSLDTSKTCYLNIGGFVHHDENGAILAKDLEYSMDGYIREFMMFRESLSDTVIKSITKNIDQIVS